MIPSDNFSLRRAISFGRSFQPMLRIQMMVYPAVALLYCLSIVTLGKSPLGIPVVALISLVVAALMYLSPLVFTSGSGLVVETELPVRGDEKATFMIAYSLVLMPLVLLVPQWILHWLANNIYTEWFTDNIFVKTSELNNYTFLNIAQSIAPAAVCLFCVSAYQRRRVLMPIVWTICATMGIGILSGVLVIVKLFSNGFIDGLTDQPAMTDENLIVDKIMNQVSPELMMLGILLGAVTLFFGWMAFRKIAYRQI